MPAVACDPVIEQRLQSLDAFFVSASARTFFFDRLGLVILRGWFLRLSPSGLLLLDLFQIHPEGSGTR